MKTSFELKETREHKINEMDSLLEKARNEALEGEKIRTFTAPEQAKFDGLEAEIRSLDQEIDRAVVIEDAEKRSLAAKNQTQRPQNAPKDTEENLYKKFSWGRAVRIAAKMEEMSGAEAEVHQMAVEEGKRSGTPIEGFGIPANLFVGNRTHYTAGAATTALDLAKEMYSPLIESLLPKLMVTRLGATVSLGNTGVISKVKKGGYLTATWKAEETAVSEMNNTFVQTNYSPEKLGALTYVTKKMLAMDSYGLENIIKTDLVNATQIALDKTALNGGGSNEPSGILANASIGSAVMGTHGGVPTRAKIVELETAIETALADLNNLKFLTTPAIKGYLRSLATDAGSGLFVWENDNKLIGYNAYASTQVPSTLTKGNSSGNCHALIFGDFSKLTLAQWNGLDLVVNPYSYAKEGYIEIVANSFWNIIIDYPECFAAIEDLLLTAYTS
jgi:HK97 family phage major capsid protein